jgi:steroid delta-isomerase-like uncharacterized protein
MNTGKVDITVETMAAVELLGAVRMALNRGDTDSAVDQFSDQFKFHDQALELEFTDKAGLTEFFEKARELFPDCLVLTDTIFTSGDHLISEWTLQATVTEALFPQGPLKRPITLRGVSVLRIKNGKIINWSDYYDGLKARRNALAACFTEWVEL